MKTPKPQNTTSQEHQDRLSSLPTHILTTILSLLPLKPAAETSTLSRRYRHLFNHLTQLHLHFSPHSTDPTTFRNFLSFISALDSVLIHLNPRKLHSVDIILSASLSTNESSLFFSRLESWIPRICECNSNNITITINVFRQRRLFSLPRCLFQTESLVEIKLFGGNFKFVLPDEGDWSVRLPNLKKLELDIDLCVSHCGLLRMVLESCRILEHLDLRLSLAEEEGVYVVEILVPSLKFLSLDLVSIWGSCEFVIDAPKLESIRIKGSLALYVVKGSSWSALSKAEICLNRFVPENAEIFLSSLLWMISSVESLLLSGYTLSVFNCISFRDDISLPVFRDLIRLEIASRTPELLILSNVVPSVLLTSVKRVVLEVLLGTHVDVLLIRHIREHAVVLEQLKARLCYEEENKEQQLCKEYRFCQELSKLWPSSEICDIEFFGYIVTASNNDIDRRFFCKMIL